MSEEKQDPQEQSRQAVPPPQAHAAPPQPPQAIPPHAHTASASQPQAFTQAQSPIAPPPAYQQGYPQGYSAPQVPPGAYGYGYGMSQPPAQPYQRANSSKATGALVCGILAIIFSTTIIFGIVLGIVAIVLAGQYVKELKRDAGSLGVAPDSRVTGGKICGIIGLILSLLMLIFVAFAIAAGVAAYNNRYHSSYLSPYYISGREMIAEVTYDGN